MKAKPAVAISYHPIDAAFAQHLVKQLKQLNFETVLLESNDAEQNYLPELSTLLCELVLIRPEYLRIRHRVEEITYLERCQIPVIPILRSPVSIEEWPIQLVFQGIVDLSEYNSDNPLLLQPLMSKILDIDAALKRPVKRSEISLNGSNMDLELGKEPIFPVNLRLELNLNHIQSDLSGVTPNQGGRTMTFDSLDEVADIVDSFVLLSEVGNEYGSLFKRFALSRSGKSERINPQSFYIDAAKWCTNLTVQENLKSNCNSTDNPYEDLQTDEIELFLDAVSELGEASKILLRQLKDWLVGTPKPQKIIITGQNFSFLDYAQLQLPIVHISEPQPMDIRKYQKSLSNVITDYAGTLTEVDLSDAYFLYQHRGFLELSFNQWSIYFSGQQHLTVRDLISAGITRIPKLNSVNPELDAGLSSLAEFITEQSPPANSVSYALALSILGGQLVVDDALATQTISRIGDRIRFSSSTHQAYYAAKRLEHSGIRLRLVEPEFNQRQVRQKRNYDEAIVIHALLASNASELLLSIATVDPFFALDCVLNGARVSHAAYNQLIDKAVESMTRFGDRRIYLALRLAYFDAAAATGILLEVMRNAVWDDRLLASHFLEYVLVTPLPGLSDFLNDETNEYDFNVIDALKVLRSTALPTIFLALKHDNARVRKKAAWVLSELKDAAATPRLIELLSDIDDGVVTEAIKSLSSIESHVLDNFTMSTLSIHNEGLQVDDESALRIIESNLTEGLNDMIVEPPKNSVLSALHTVGRLNRKSARIVNTVRKAMAKIIPSATIDSNGNESSSRIVKRRLITAIGERQGTASHELHDIGPEVATVAENQDLEMAELMYQLKRLRTGDWNAREDAAKVIRNYTKSITVEPSHEIMRCLTDLLNDKDWLVRWTCIEALAWLQSPESVPALIESIHDVNWKVRVAVIHSLVKIGDRLAVTAIIESMSDGNPLVREAAVEASGNLRLHEAIPSLRIAIQDPEEFVRISAVEALAQINNTLVVDSLFVAIEDPSVHVRWAAVNALSGFATSKDVPRLRNLLDDTDGPYWEQKRICDVVADILEQLDQDTSKVS